LVGMQLRAEHLISTIASLQHLPQLPQRAKLLDNRGT